MMELKNSIMQYRQKILLGCEIIAQSTSQKFHRFIICGWEKAFSCIERAILHWWRFALPDTVDLFLLLNGWFVPLVKKEELMGTVHSLDP